MADPTLYRLLSWLSPSYPVGAFAYSHGIEWMVGAGAIKDEASLTAWIDDLLSHGGPWSDAVAFSHALEAGDDLSELRNINEFVVAMAPSEERHLETTAQGNAFLTTTLDAWSWDGGPTVAETLAAEQRVALEKRKKRGSFAGSLYAGSFKRATKVAPSAESDAPPS